MIKESTPFEAGIENKYIAEFFNHVKKYNINFHSVLMLRGENLFCERYWAPFTKSMRHRMYSVTKSFVSIAIGCLIDEGKLKLSDHIIDFFPDKLPENPDPLLKQQTIEDMLTMRTCFLGVNWFTPDVTDRLKFYFSLPVKKIPGTIFDYDSTGSYVLGCLVERLSQMSLLDYMKLKFLDSIGGFEDAEILKVSDGTPWADSALICTPRALLNFSRFVLNHGAWEGKQLVSEEYVKAATSKQTDNNLVDSVSYDHYGYGYKFWMGENNSFYCYGMGGQFAICFPEKDFIFVCTSDVQLSYLSDKPLIHRLVIDDIYNKFDGDCKKEISSELEDSFKLSVARGDKFSEFSEKINGKVFICDTNIMGIKQFKFIFNGNDCVFHYMNEQGDKNLPFGMKENIYTKFPQYGYSNKYGNAVTTDGFQYNCAVSAGWIMNHVLQMKVQVIDNYLGTLVITVDFKNENEASIMMCKRAENFFDEYEGVLKAFCK